MIKLLTRLYAANAKRNLKDLHKDEQGAESIEKLLIIGLIVLPLLILLVWFRDEISNFMKDKWSDVEEDADVDLVP